MAGRFPGAAGTSELWKLLCEGHEAIREFTREELLAAGVDEATLADPKFVNAGAPLEDAGGFDAAFFGYTPREAELMDPQHRIFLECCWHALEDAGYAPEKYRGLVSVFGGVARNTYLLNYAQTYVDLQDAGGAYEAMLGSDKDYAATRVAYKLNLRGASFNVQSACSSSGVATHLAVQALLNGDCDIALAGGARVDVPQTAGYRWIEGRIPSRDGHCRAFDADASGCVYGSGAAVVVLKRLTDSVEDGDSIYAVIKATAINNDGSQKIGFTAPSVIGQREVIESALSIAEVAPETIGYVEAHGTGTRIGDPIEISALTQAYRRYTNQTGYCAVGSLKTNIGHLDAGSGVASIIKIALMLHHGKLVPSVNFRQPNPEIDFKNSPFFVITEHRDWPATKELRRAAVSSFGLGGTNFHAILEQAPNEQKTNGKPGPDAKQEKERPVLLPMSAATETSLAITRERLASFAEAGGVADLADVAYTLQVGRTDFGYRQVIVACSTEEWIDGLRRAARPTRANAGLDRVCFMFPGQGTQYPNMGRGVYESCDVFRHYVDRCSSILEPCLGEDLRKLVFVDGHLSAPAKALSETRMAQPALFAIGYALAKQWMHWGVRPSTLVGHSVGEYVAACLADVFSLEDALAIVAKRGELMQQMPAGSMLAVTMSADALRERLDEYLEVATLNAPSLCVVGGETDRIGEFASELKAEGVDATLLNTSHAFHTRMMEGMLDAFRAYMRSIVLHEPSIPFVSNTTGSWITSQAADPEYWVQHVRQPVRFGDCLATLTSGEPSVLLETGPGNVLSELARQAVGPGHPVVSSLPRVGEDRDDLKQLLNGFGEVWAHGVPVDWSRVSAPRRRAHIPGYSFEHKTYWLGAQMALVGLPSNEQEPLERRELPMRTKKSITEQAGGRGDRIRQTVKTVLFNLSGVGEDQLDDHRSFVELGFDSLFLTRAAMSLQEQFGIEIGFRMLVEETPSISAFSEWLDEHLPSEAFQPPQQPIPVVAEGLQSPPVTGPTNSLTELMQEQVRLLNQHVSLIQEWANAQTEDAAVPKPVRAGAAAKATAQAEPVQSGPWRPISIGVGEPVSASQREFLTRLRENLERKTRGSKEHTARHQAHLADPRAVEGYRQAWKELVYPIVADRSDGSRIWDVDGNEFVDFAMSFGASLFGHRPEFVTRAVSEQLERGFEIGPTHPLAGETAALLCEISGHDRAAFCNTGSEAVLAAIRVARTVTGRGRIVFFSGDYHGLFDEVLASSYGGVVPHPIAPGIPASAVQNVVVLDYGKQSALEVIRAQQNEIAAVIVEPVQSSHPDLQPAGFLKSLRKLTASAGIALVFDEIITGFRCHPRGAQGFFGIQADIATYGKAIGGGFPIAAVAGSARYLDAVDGGAWEYGDDSHPHVGRTWFGGTFVRHPIALAATHACLSHFRQAGPSLQERLNATTRRFVAELNAHCRRRDVPLHVESFASLFHIKFQAHRHVATLLLLSLRDRGIHVADTEARAAFVSTAHTDADLELFRDAFCTSVDALVESGWLPSNRRAPLSEREFGALVDALERDRPAFERDCEASRFTQNAALICRANELCTALVLALFRSSGLPVCSHATVQLKELKKRLRVTAEYDKAIDYMVSLLSQDGLAWVEDGVIRFGGSARAFRGFRPARPGDDSTVPRVLRAVRALATVLQALPGGTWRPRAGCQCAAAGRGS